MGGVHDRLRVATMRRTPNSEQIPINIVGWSRFGLNAKINNEKTYNMFVSDGWLVNMPGWQRVLDLFPAGQGRGAFLSVRGNFAIVVVNKAVIQISPSLGTTMIGNLVTTTGEVFIDENLEGQICIVDGLNAYIYYWPSGFPNLTVQTSVSSVFTPNYVTFHNTYFLFGNADRTAAGAIWYQYVFNTNTTISLVTPTGTALQTKPDYAQAVVRIPGQAANVLVIGSTVSEVWTQIPGNFPPYVRNQSFNIDYGCVSVDTIAFSDTYVIWLGANQTNTPVIYVFNQQNGEPVSTDGIDNLLRLVQFPGQSTAILYRQDGHLFYQLTFYNPVDNLTIIYDFTNKHFYHGSDYNLNYHPARQVFLLNNKTYFVSLNNAAIYEMSPDIRNINEQTPSSVFPDDPRLVYAQQRIRICEPIRRADSAPFRLNDFVFTIRQGNEDILNFDNDIWMITEQGIRIFSEDNKQVIPEFGGSASGLFIDYYAGRVDLSLSRDGGETYSNTVGRIMNKLAHRQNIMRWESLGSGNDIQPKLRFWNLGSLTANNGYVSMVS